MKTHMHRHHPSLLCLPRSKLTIPWKSASITTAETPALPEVQHAGKSTARSTVVSVTASTSMLKQASLFESMRQSKPYSSNSEKAQNVTQKIATFIVKDMRPYSLVDSKAFRDMIKALDPRYQVPSRNEFTEIIIPEMYSRTSD